MLLGILLFHYLFFFVVVVKEYYPFLLETDHLKHLLVPYFPNDLPE